MNDSLKRATNPGTRMLSPRFWLPCILWSLLAQAAVCQTRPVACWSFDWAEEGGTWDSAGERTDRLGGNSALVEGVAGRALKFDGFTTRVVRPAEAAPVVTGGFAIEAWIAVRAYPWGWCPVVSQRQGEEAGYFLGIDAQGRLGLQLSVDGKWRCCTSESFVPLLDWTHVAGSFDPSTGLHVYIDGRPMGRLEVQGEWKPASDVDLLLGRNHGPQPAMFETNELPVNFSWDGLLDEVKIYDRPLTADDVRNAYESLEPSGPPPLSQSRLPSGPPADGRFGAFYETLKFHPAWDAMWRSSGPDVVVAFDRAPFRLVCWRGISYAPCWVTEQGNWFTNEFMERGVDRGDRGCCESMSDKRADYSHVKILENSDARAVVYWRHAPVDIYYQTPFVDEETGWGDWSEEYHTIYPDGVAVRKVVMYSNNFDDWHEWCQSIEPLHPGQRPEDVLDGDRILSLANMQGEGKTYGWQPGPKSYNFPALPGANMQITYLRSQFNPFLVLDDRPGLNDRGHQGPEITLVGGDGWSEHSPFPWRNHWPVTQVPIIGRYAVAADRPSHTYTSTQHSAAFATTKHSITKVMLCGMTDRPQATDLLPLARSWLRAPEMQVTSSGDTSLGFDLTERAYVVHRTTAEPTSTFVCRWAASEQRPVINPAIVVQDWGDEIPTLKLNGQVVPRGEKFRFGHRRRLDRTDLVLWIELDAEELTLLELYPTGAAGK